MEEKQQFVSLLSSDQAMQPVPCPSNAKPLEEAMQPMTKEWPAPGLEKK